ncbi:MAG: ABC transporter permease [Methylovulum sp.]|jgi:peptide/nickel transport system permease protein|nr:ABC transporter permease [Methylovulum sp.]MCF7998873.1 ABC transporter permease [Methylovulum sp.]
MIILWTDGLLFALVFLLLGLGFYWRGKVAIKRPMQQIARNPTGMAALVVLLFFMLIGLLDSIHYQATEKTGHTIISLLDDWATPLRQHGEKTYSAPFAATLYSKEMMVLADGSTIWAYPRLEFGGRHLITVETQYIPDVLQKTAVAFIKGAGLALLCTGLLFALLRHRLPYASVYAVLATVFSLLLSAYLLTDLSAYYHVFGTDKVGEDVFYQALKSIRTGLLIGSLTTFIMLPLAIVFGILAGFFQGWVDDLIQYVYTTLNSIPSVLLIAASILMVQVYMAKHEEAFTSVIVRADMRLLFLCLILGVTSWTGLCRLLRAETLKLREMEFVQAAQALGVKKSQILFRHILPNVMHLVLISVVLDFSSLVLAEAVLSYINIGVDPTTYSWGNMINGARLEMAREPLVWWSLTAAFVFMFALVLAANLFADTVQEAFDPRRSEQ